MNNDKQYPLRILQIGMSTNYGGTEAFLMNLYRNIDRNKYQFDFLNVYDEPLVCQSEIISLGGIVYNLHLRRREDGIKKYKVGIKKFYKEHHFDVVVQNVQDLINIDMLIYAKKYGINKRIIYGHNSGFGVKPSKLSFISHILNKLRINRYVTNQVVLSDKVNHFLFKKKDRFNSIIIPGFIDVNSYKFNESFRKIIKEKYHLNNHKVYGSVLRFDPQKNPLFLLDVFRIIVNIDNNSRLVLVGSGPSESMLKKRVDEMGISDNVIFAGYIASVNEYYSAFDIFLFPTSFEGFGIVLLEAQASGLPIVCSKGVPTNVVATDLIKYVDIKDGVKKWADEAMSVQQNEKREDYYKLVEKAFPRDIIISAICELYE